MFTPAFHDLLKPQWLATLIELKSSGGLAVSELSTRLGSSYMTVKQHCEDLTKRGYLKRSRVPRTAIGRPEIFYRLSEKANGLFPTIPVSFTLEMLDQIKQLFGENAPERLLFQHFQNQEEIWKTRLSKGTTLLYKAQLFVKIREKDGLFMRCLYDADTGAITLREFHHPLRSIFEIYPRAITIEQRAMEAALGLRLIRQEVGGSEGVPAYVDYLLGGR
jgi:predicted ArsR family transcriptional regulator